MFLKSLLAFACAIGFGGYKVSKVEEPEPIVEECHVPAMVETTKIVVEVVAKEVAKNCEEAVEYAVVQGAYLVCDAFADKYEEATADLGKYETYELYAEVFVGFTVRNVVYFVSQLTKEAGYEYLLSDYNGFITSIDENVKKVVKEIVGDNELLYTYVIGIIAKLNLGA